jgi:hypothetical protein
MRLVLRAGIAKSNEGELRLVGPGGGTEGPFLAQRSAVAFDAVVVEGVGLEISERDGVARAGFRIDHTGSKRLRFAIDDFPVTRLIGLPDDDDRVSRDRLEVRSANDGDVVEDCGCVRWFVGWRDGRLVSRFGCG